ncbi:MAG: DNA-deoxyinosine glycosylase [Methanospirillum sp.]|uniref:DNA-deoxyinosine glycosylase n=1 Tax=Methanospirillum sp. TaxID=45200 RepID=UPI00236A9460|nr:DNA-deoxyinosine glycosylase [Methanospirillum sp.]MDD1728294.1 DNA-deoxyinosine glycosylase [Methanospirillum sp.]
MIISSVQFPRLYGLHPVIDDTSQVLIVGSFPSTISLQKSQYYANPRNDFWKIMEVVIGMPHGLQYQTRIDYLLSQGIALWDVVSSCTRVGSADATIRDPNPASIGSLLIRYPAIRAIFCNGRRAETGLVHAMTHEQSDVHPDQVHIGYIPSSSPAHAIKFQEKCRSWLVIRDFLALTSV